MFLFTALMISTSKLDLKLPIMSDDYVDFRLEGEEEEGNKIFYLLEWKILSERQFHEVDKNSHGSQTNQFVLLLLFYFPFDSLIVHSE